MEEIQTEVWKEVEGWNGKYEVSNTGEVRNAWDNVPVAKVIAGIPQYWYVNLRHPNSTRKLVRVHRLVAQAFIPNPDNYAVVDHIDRDKMNNHVTNLRWTDVSGNQRNTDAALFVGGVHILDFVERYESPLTAYRYLHYYLKSGMSEESAISKYEEYTKYGFKTSKVEYKGNQVYLYDLCKQFEVSYVQVSSRLYDGWDLWNALYNIKPSWVSSFEVIDYKGVGHWYKDDDMFKASHPEALYVFRRLVDEGLKLEDILAYDGKDYLRQTIGGFIGTIPELCKHFGKTESSVSTRRGKGMSLEEALLSPPERVKKVTIDGVTGSPKYWYEHFGLDYKTVKRKKDTLKCSFEDILKYFNVDLTGKSIRYTD